MLTIAEILPLTCVSTRLDASTKSGVLAQIAELYRGAKLEIEPEKIAEVLAERERLASTGVGSGVAIPHGRVAGLPGVRCVLGIHRSGVDFQAIDGEPVHLIIGVLAPDGQASQHLKVLARISRLFRSAELREALMNAADDAEAHRLLVKADEQVSIV